MKLDNDAIKKSMLLYAITDRGWLKEGETLESVVEDVLKQNEITAPVIKVYNKCDLKEDVPKDGIAISAKKNIGIDKLKQAILEHME